MSDLNPYAPPVANVEAPKSVAPPPCFFSTSPLKLCVMTVCTLGLYYVFWFYKNFALIKQRQGSKIMPFWRGIFSPIWAYHCFKEIETASAERGLPAGFNSAGLATGYFFLNVAGRLPDPYWLLFFLSLLILLQVNRAALAVNRHENPEFENNASFSPLNWVAILVGGVLFIGAVVGSFMPADPPVSP